MWPDETVQDASEGQGAHAGTRTQTFMQDLELKKRKCLQCLTGDTHSGQKYKVLMEMSI